MEERGGLTGWDEGVEGLCAGEGDVGGSPGERQEVDRMSGAGSGATQCGEEGLKAGTGLVAAEPGLMEGEAAMALPGLGAVGGPRGLGDTGGGTRLDSGQTWSWTESVSFDYNQGSKYF